MYTFLKSLKLEKNFKFWFFIYIYMKSILSPLNNLPLLGDILLKYKYQINISNTK